MAEATTGQEAYAKARENSITGASFEPANGVRGDLVRIKPKELAESGIKGEILVGRYEGTLPNKMNENAPDFKFRGLNDTLFIVNSCGSLKYAMKNIAEGDLVQLVYNGQSKMASGPAKGKLAHSFNVNKAVDSE
jgi:hypothetical protein